MNEQPQTIWDLPAGPWTTLPRYHSPGCHPAMQHHRELLIAARSLRTKIVITAAVMGFVPEVRALDELIGDTEQRLADFEGTESEAKARADQQLRGWSR